MKLEAKHLPKFIIYHRLISIQMYLLLHICWRQIHTYPLDGCRWKEPGIARYMIYTCSRPLKSELNRVVFFTQRQDTTVLVLNASWADHSAGFAALASTDALYLITAAQWLDYSRHWAKYLDDFLLGMTDARETPTVSPVYYFYLFFVVLKPEDMALNNQSTHFILNTFYYINDIILTVWLTNTKTVLMFWLDGAAQWSHAFIWAASYFELYKISWTVNCLESYLTGSRHPPALKKKQQKKKPSPICLPLPIPPVCHFRLSLV